eukprot:1607950-Rhodomonas_salina.4
MAKSVTSQHHWQLLLHHGLALHGLSGMVVWHFRLPGSQGWRKGGCLALAAKLAAHILLAAVIPASTLLARMLSVLAWNRPRR